MSEYRVIYPVTGALLYGNVLRGEDLTKQEDAMVELSEETAYDYTGTIGVPLIEGDTIVAYLFDDPDYIPIAKETYDPPQFIRDG